MRKVPAAMMAALGIVVSTGVYGTAFAHGRDSSNFVQSPRASGLSTARPGRSAGVKSSISGPYAKLIAHYAQLYDIRPRLADAVVRIESRYDPRARGQAGEIGLMQIKPSTARLMGYGGSVRELYKPSVNLKYGMMYLAEAKALGDGSVCGTILKYNAGHGAEHMNPISKRYCERVTSALD